MIPNTTESGGATSGQGCPLTPARVGVLQHAVHALIFIFENTRATRIRQLNPEVTNPQWIALLATRLRGVRGVYAPARR